MGNSLPYKLYLNINDEKVKLSNTGDRVYFQLQVEDKANTDKWPEHYGVSASNPDSIGAYKVLKAKGIAELERVAYNLKVLDYFDYTISNKANDYVVLDKQGRYAVIDTTVVKDPEKVKKVALTEEIDKFYLRFSYVDNPGANETEYYALVDRIKKNAFDAIFRLTGVTLVPSLGDNSHTASEEYGGVSLSINDLTLFAEPQIKTLANRVSTYAIEPVKEELYRRFDKDGLRDRTEEGDNPGLVEFFRNRNYEFEYLFEDCESIYTTNRVDDPHYLGVENKEDNKHDVETGKRKDLHSYSFYVDTAYVNRGTGTIKPQYLLVVGAEINLAGRGCSECGDTVEYTPYVSGRFLFNATSLARKDGLYNQSIIDDNYGWEKFDRLIFVEAIHKGDSLYILNGVDLAAAGYTLTDVITGQPYVNFETIVKDVKDEKTKIEIVPLDDNKHKDYVFSFRFVEKQLLNDGTPNPIASNKFLIESESTDRSGDPVIAPLNGGWIKIQNGVPVISRGAYNDPIVDAEEWNAATTTAPAVANEPVVQASNVSVIAGVGSVTIQNASGKKVAISNILGQTLVSAILTSDQVTVSVPKGVIVVAVEGENAVKAVVK
jgi:hypothetical protein